MVDDEVFVEGNAADIGCHGSEWRCDFRFVGQKVLEFEVFKTNGDGVTLAETDHVVERYKYMHKCTVTVLNDKDLRTAEFFIDGQHFRELPVKKPQSFRQEDSLSISPSELLQSYGIAVPYKVDRMAPSGIACLAQSASASAESSKNAASGLFAWLYDDAIVESTTSFKLAYS